MSLLDNLNEVQKDIIQDTEGAVLVLAGAGSGKTRVLTHRIAHLIQENNINSYNILAITFTNKATDEMKERLEAMLGETHRVFISTFHSFCAFVLRNNIEDLKDGEKTRFNRNFSIIDAADQKRILKKIIKTLGYDDIIKAEAAISHVSLAKQDVNGISGYIKSIKLTESYYNAIENIIDNYIEHLESINCLDFDDLLLLTKEIFETNDKTLEYYQDRFRYIHVDEFQDTNPLQFRIVELLQKKYGNIFVVGDDDQSIYGWRGADVNLMLDIEKHFDKVKVYKLEQNYRSTPPILRASNALIKNNAMRRDKTLYTQIEGNVGVTYQRLSNEKDEATWIASEICKLKQNYGYSNREIAVLMRTAALTRNFEAIFSKVDLSYRVMGGFKFFERAEIKDVISYLTVLANPKNEIALIRIMQYPSKGIGETTINRLLDSRNEIEKASGKSISLYDVIVGLDGEYKDVASTMRVTNKLLEFKEMLSKMQELLQDLNSNKIQLFELVKEVIKIAKFKEAYDKKDDIELYGRWENIGEFVAMVKAYQEDEAISGLNELLEKLSLISEYNEEGDSRDQLTLATIHAVKGLEFKVVFIAGVEQNILPHIISIREGNIEEERRIMYVAMTRAKERLYITHTYQRFMFDGSSYSSPSNFILEAQGKPIAEKTDSNMFSSDDCVSLSTEKQAKFIVASQKPAPIFASNEVLKKYKQGVKVEHRRYGIGTINLVTGKDDDMLLQIDFGELGIRKFIANQVNLTIVEE